MAAIKPPDRPVHSTGKMTAYKPIVGCIVHYYREPAGRADNTQPSDPGPDPEGKPQAAIITEVLTDSTIKPEQEFVDQYDPRTGKIIKVKVEPEKETRVNLAVFTTHGGHYGRENVLLLQESYAEFGTQFAEWPENAEARKKLEEDAREEAAEAAAKQAEADLKAKEAAEAKARARAETIVALGSKTA